MLWLFLGLKLFILNFILIFIEFTLITRYQKNTKKAFFNKARCQTRQKQRAKKESFPSELIETNFEIMKRALERICKFNETKSTKQRQ